MSEPDAVRAAAAGNPAATGALGSAGRRGARADAPVQARRLARAVDVATALSALRDEPLLAALDSSGGLPADWSVVAWRGAPLAAGIATFEALRAELARHGALPSAARPPAWPRALDGAPFCGGFLGALAYEFAPPADVALPAEPWGFPLAAGVVAREFLLFDHRAGDVWWVHEPGADDAARERALAGRLASAPARGAVRPLGALVRHVPPFVHRARVEALRRAIRSGDVYQANLAHRFTRLLAGHPIDLHLALRAAHPAPYAGYLALPPGPGFAGGALLSHSPELLLEVDGQRARTRPIKGTSPRSQDPAEDAARRESLARDPKERAELAMIVDLERNDLGRVAAVGGVRVPAFARVESYASVHHLVADVEATLAPGADALGALAALFPGGSVTGAPKLAAMERIAALEREGRGFFTGAFGCLAFDGRAAFDVSIRSPLWRRRPELDAHGAVAGEVSLRVGGGITWDSDPSSEERETLHKAAAFLRAFEGSDGA